MYFRAHSMALGMLISSLKEKNKRELIQQINQSGLWMFMLCGLLIFSFVLLCTMLAMEMLIIVETCVHAKKARLKHYIKITGGSATNSVCSIFTLIAGHTLIFPSIGVCDFHFVEPFSCTGHTFCVHYISIFALFL